MAMLDAIIGEPAFDLEQERARHQLLGDLFPRGAGRLEELGAEGVAHHHRLDPLLGEQPARELRVLGAAESANRLSSLAVASRIAC